MKRCDGPENLLRGREIAPVERWLLTLNQAFLAGLLQKEPEWAVGERASGRASQLALQKTQ